MKNVFQHCLNELPHIRHLRKNPHIVYSKSLYALYKICIFLMNLNRLSATHNIIS